MLVLVIIQCALSLSLQHSIDTSTNFAFPLAALDWSNMSSINYLVPTHNSLSPSYCKSAWALVATSTLASRFKVLLNSSYENIMLSAQVLLSCNYDSSGCSGGDFMSAFNYIYENGITDETCQAYLGKGLDQGYTCGSFDPCYTCTANGVCGVPDHYDLYNLTKFEVVSGEENMISSLQTGPIACGIQQTEEFKNYTSGIIQGGEGNVSLNHAVEIVGYGETNELKFWKARNTWGTYWGSEGFFMIQRGNNTLGIEQYCGVPTPDPVIKRVKSQGRGGGGTINSISKLFIRSLVKNPVPSKFDWRNINGINYLTVTRNQNIPKYCQSSWAHAATSAVADRFNILFNGTWNFRTLSPQVLINCKAGGDCNGGDVEAAYQFMVNSGIPDDTCQEYVAANPGEGVCTQSQVCQRCQQGELNCSAVENPKKWFIKSFGFVAGAEKMKQEIFDHGPITCGIEATKNFQQYSGGIYSQKLKFPRINHIVSIVGWGSENSTEFWIGRNSWGTYWGESGYFQIQMHSDNLGIETDCSYGIPSLQPNNPKP